MKRALCGDSSHAHFDERLAAMAVSMARAMTDPTGDYTEPDPESTPSQTPEATASQVIFEVVGFTRHRPWCPEFKGPGDCTCGLYRLLDSIICTCGHKVSVHTDRDVDDVVGWPCIGCKSARCRGFIWEEHP